MQLLRVAGNKKAGPNYGDINRFDIKHVCTWKFYDRLETKTPFPLGMTTNQFDVELARMPGKKVNFLSDLAK